MMLNCIAIDDEPLALRLLSHYIEQTPFLHLNGAYASAIAGLGALHASSIDLVYLDIQMPDLNGIELARIIVNRPQMPRIILTTAFAEFSLEGYKVDALDYLLKPFNYEEFLRAATKAHTYFELVRSPLLPTSASETNNPEDQYLFVKVEYQLVRIAFDDILYCEGLKDYVKIILLGSQKAILSRTTLKALEEKLPSRRFMRVHRSFIVALDKVSSISRNALTIANKNIAVGDIYKESFSRFVERWS